MSSLVVESIDGEAFPVEKARQLSKRLFYGGFAALPLFWLVNVWLFWPDFRSGRDAVVHKFAKHSAYAFGVASVLFLPWMLLYMIDGKKVLGESRWAEIDATRLDLAGLGF